MKEKPNWSERNPEYQKEYYEKNKEKINQKKKECRQNKSEAYKEVAKKRYDLKREHILNLSKQRRKENPEKTLLVLAKQRAKKKGVPFDLSVEDIKIPLLCPLLNIELCPSSNTVSRNSPTLDRIIPDLGYVKGNVWVISMRANLIKNDASLSDLKTITNNLEKKLNAK